MIVPLADHGLLIAVPFVGPALLLGLGLAWLALRERIRDRDGSNASGEPTSPRRGRPSPTRGARSS